MMARKRWSFATLMLIAAAPLAFGQEGTDKPDDSVTHSGFTGLFNVISPDTLDPGHLSFGVIYRNWDRDNADIDVNDVSAAIAIGLMKRLEIGIAYDANRQVDYDDPFTSRFYNDLPFATTTIDNGGGDFRAGLKFSLVRMEESTGGLSLYSGVKVPLAKEEDGFGTGGVDVGVGMAGGLAAGPVAFYGNAAYNFIGNAHQPGPDLDLADRLDFGAGLAIGARSVFKGIIEMTGEHHVNEPDGFPEQDTALDLAVGFKLGGAKHWGFSLGAAYVHNLSMGKRRADGGPTRPSGWIAELSYTSFTRPPAPPPTPPPSDVNHPPTCTLTVSPKEIYPAFSSKPHKATVSVSASDPDGDQLSYAWTATGGTIAGQGASVEYTPGDRVEEGSYTVTAKVSDGKGGEGTCTATVSVKPDPEYFDGRVQFEFDRYDLTDAARDVIQKAAEHLKRHGNLKVQIEGHTCYIATEEYNMALGQHRAEAVRAQLVALGVDAARVSTVSYGETRPWQDNTREITRRLNRRGEFRFKFSE